MLREVKNAAFERRGLWLWQRYLFTVGGVEAKPGLRPAEFAAAQRLQAEMAVRLHEAGERRFWWCLDRFWCESEGLEASDVHALAFERLQARDRKLRRAHAVVAAGTARASARDPVPLELRQAVFERDGGRCAECGAAFDLQFDHVIPVALGGATSEANLQLLCGSCNRVKGATLG